jgi:hypothetical protein
MFLSSSSTTTSTKVVQSGLPVTHFLQGEEEGSLWVAGQRTTRTP